MKKLIALLWAAVMSFALVACGGGEEPLKSTADLSDLFGGGSKTTAETTTATTESLTNDTSVTTTLDTTTAETPAAPDYSDHSANSKDDETESELTQLLCEKNVWYGMRHGVGNEEEFTFFEDGHFEKNGSSFTWTLNEYLPDASEFLASCAFQTTPNYDAARGLYVTDEFLLGYDTDGNLLLYWRDYFCYNESLYELVEITLDNWQEYFEVRPIYHILENGFGEFEEIVVYCCFINKEGINIDVYNSDVTIECTYSFCSTPYTVDFESGQVTFGENGTVVGVYQKTKTAETMKFDDEYWLAINLSTNYGAALDGEIGLVDEFEITRIQGAIMVSR